MTLWLVGMMGSGKSRVGRLIAKELELPFHDTDDEVVARTGRSIESLWSDNGEEAFREIEAEVLQELAGSDVVVATGGGVVLDPSNRELMRETGRVVWLRAESSSLARRVGQDRDRPLLTDVANRESELARIFEDRVGLYQDAADCEIETTDMDIEQVVEKVIRLCSG